jgi:hypothetical protein
MSGVICICWSAGLMFRQQRAVLDLETLRPHGKLSFIL